MITCRHAAGFALIALLALPGIAWAQDGGFPDVPTFDVSDVPSFDPPSFDGPEFDFSFSFESQFVEVDVTVELIPGDPIPEPRVEVIVLVTPGDPIPDVDVTPTPRPPPPPCHPPLVC